MPLVLGQGGEPVVRHLDVVVPVTLQDVSPHLVDSQALLHVPPVEVEVEHALGVPHGLDEVLLREVVRETLKRLGLVLGEGIVHVEAHGLR